MALRASRTGVSSALSVRIGCPSESRSYLSFQIGFIAFVDTKEAA